jgi:transcriptional regulator with XRE-family HTH domain
VVALRQALGLSQQRFADLVGVSRSYLGDVEAGRSEASGAMLTAITSATDVDGHWLLTGQGEMRRALGVREPAQTYAAGLPAEDAQALSELMTALRTLDAPTRQVIVVDARHRAQVARELARLRADVDRLAGRDGQPQDPADP